MGLSSYSFKFSINMLFCLDPVPPSGWVNVQLLFSVAVSDEGQNIYNADFALLLPIISAED